MRTAGQYYSFAAQAVAVQERVFRGHVCRAWQQIGATSAEAWCLIYVAQCAVNGLEFLLPQLCQSSTSAQADSMLQARTL